MPSRHDTELNWILGGEAARTVMWPHSSSCRGTPAPSGAQPSPSLEELAVSRAWDASVQRWTSELAGKSLS